MPPPIGPNSFIFAYIFTEKCPHWRPKPPKWVHTPLQKILDPALIFTKKCPCQRSTPPQWVPPPLREILDPPLHYLTFSVLFLFYIIKKKVTLYTPVHTYHTTVWDLFTKIIGSQTAGYIITWLPTCQHVLCSRFVME